jgi:hypothetical protein
VREITRKIDEQINSVRRELANLLSIGIISSDTSNNKLYYEVNQKFEHYDALAEMFGGKQKQKRSAKKKSSGDEADETVLDDSTAALPAESFADEHIHNIVRAGNVRALVYTGQFTRDDSVGVDIVIIGDMNIPNLEHAIANLEAAEKKELRYAVLSPEDYQYRKQINDRFLANVLVSKKIVHLDRDRHIE